MNVQFFLTDGSKLIFETAAKKHRGTLLGTNVWQCDIAVGTITIQEFEKSLFQISHRLLKFFTRVKLSVIEGPGLRLEALLTGEVQISEGERKIKLKAGQYRLSDIPQFTALFQANSACNIFITH